MRTVAPLVGAVLAITPCAAGAQLVPPSGEAPSRGPEAAQSCTWCHGPRGAGDPEGAVPRIAGLSRYYGVRQLRSYANGSRRHPAMEAVAKGMSPQEMDVVSTYFAQLDAPVARTAPSALPAGVAERGRTLATAGSAELRVQGCNNCHGPGGTGSPPAIPYLAGQGARYLAATLHAWRAGTRRNDAGGQMATIARALTPEAIEDVARYYASLPAPPTRPDAIARSPRSPAPPATAAPARFPAVDLRAADPARGQAILASGAYGCAGCHAIPGVRRANGVVGPPLGGLTRRGFIAGQLPNRPEVLVAFMLDPPALVPRTGMPATGLTRDEALHVAAYLYTLGR